MSVCVCLCFFLPPTILIWLQRWWWCESAVVVDEEQQKKNTNNKFASYHYYYHYSIYYFSQPSAHFFLALFHFSSQYTTTGLHHQFTCIYPRTNATKRSNPGNNRLESSVLFSKLDLNSREILIISVNGDLQDQIVQIL